MSTLQSLQRPGTGARGSGGGAGRAPWALWAAAAPPPGLHSSAQRSAACTARGALPGMRAAGGREPHLPGRSTRNCRTARLKPQKRRSPSRLKARLWAAVTSSMSSYARYEQRSSPAGGVGHRQRSQAGQGRGPGSGRTWRVQPPRRARRHGLLCGVTQAPRPYLPADKPSAAAGKPEPSPQRQRYTPNPLRTHTHACTLAHMHTCNSSSAHPSARPTGAPAARAPWWPGSRRLAPQRSCPGTSRSRRAAPPPGCAARGAACRAARPRPRRPGRRPPAAALGCAALPARQRSPGLDPWHPTALRLPLPAGKPPAAYQRCAGCEGG